MAKLMSSQKWYQLNEYPLDYFELLYKYYAASGVRTNVTYYNLDLPNSVYDYDLLGAGSYEQMGNLSGMLWKKILLLPIYNIEQMSFTMNADERGVGFPDSMATAFIPTIYEFRPHVHDFIIYDHIRERSNPFKSEIPMYEIVNLEMASTAEITFWRLNLRATLRVKDDIEDHLSGNYTFVDYEKQIYKTSDAIQIHRLMEKNNQILINNLFNEKIGLYSEKIQNFQT